MKPLNTDIIKELKPKLKQWTDITNAVKERNPNMSDSLKKSYDNVCDYILDFNTLIDSYNSEQRKIVNKVVETINDSYQNIQSKKKKILERYNGQNYESIDKEYKEVTNKLKELIDSINELKEDGHSTTEIKELNNKLLADKKELKKIEDKQNKLKEYDRKFKNLMIDVDKIKSYKDFSKTITEFYNEVNEYKKEFKVDGDKNINVSLEKITEYIKNHNEWMVQLAKQHAYSKNGVDKAYLEVTLKRMDRNIADIKDLAQKMKGKTYNATMESLVTTVINNGAQSAEDYKKVYTIPGKTHTEVINKLKEIKRLGEELETTMEQKKISKLEKDQKKELFQLETMH